MAITKIHKINKTLSKAIKYVINEAKTSSGELVSSHNCSINTAVREFEAVSKLNIPKLHFDTNKFNFFNSIKAYHLIQSFAKDDDITPELAHEIGMKYAKEFTNNEYQFIVATHIDKGHIHNHIIFNSTNYFTFKKFHLDQKKLHERELISDKLCKEYGLSVIEKKSGLKGKSAYEYMQHNSGLSWKDKLRETIDRVVLESDDFNDFITRMEMEEGYEIKIGKYLSFRFEDGQERFTRSRRLGDNYSEAAISYRICHKELENSFLEPDGNSKKITSNNDAKIFLIAPLEKRISYLKSQNRIGVNYENKVIVSEINALVSSLNYLQKHSLLYDSDFKNRYTEVSKELKNGNKTDDKISEELLKLQSELRFLNNYLNYKTESDNFKSFSNEKSYQHKVLYDSAVHFFKEQKINPNKLDAIKIKNRIDYLQSEFKKVNNSKSILAEEKRKLDIISENLSKSINVNLLGEIDKNRNKKYQNREQVENKNHRKNESSL